MPTTAEILKKVRQVEIRTNRMVTDAMTGAYHSIFKGQGMDFEEVREYAPGDDVRGIDWNVTARMDRPFIKKFREERELTILLLVDCSASGVFGSGTSSKRELAAEIASVLAFSAIRNNDKVGALFFTDTVEKIVHPRKGRQHVLRLIRDILFFEPDRARTNIVNALDSANRLLKRHAVLFLLSDFLQGPEGVLPDPDSPTGHELFHALSLTANRHDLTCIHLTDTREQEIPDVGVLTLEDAETGDIVELDTSRKSVREGYAAENTRRVETLRTALRLTGAGTFAVETGKPYIAPLRQYFERRAHQRR